MVNTVSACVIATCNALLNGVFENGGGSSAIYDAREHRAGKVKRMLNLVTNSKLRYAWKTVVMTSVY